MWGKIKKKNSFFQRRGGPKVYGKIGGKGLTSTSVHSGSGVGRYPDTMEKGKVSLDPEHDDLTRREEKRGEE